MHGENQEPSHGDDPHYDPRTFKERLQGIMPTNYFVALMALSVVLHFVYPIAKVLYPPATYAGYLLIVFGAAMNLWTDALFKRHETTVKPYLEPSALITSGPFALSRHPMYLGMASVLLGVAVIHGTVVTFVFPAAYVALMELLFIPHEEESCVKAFGDAYHEYRRKVRRWL
jgi:protein-S-isoprenylcysteine O-methyltransferase Ste14